MRRSIVSAAVLGIVLLTGTPALAAPEVSQKTCDGVFTRDQGVKTCTTTTVGQETSVVDSAPFNLSSTVLGVEVYDIDYTGTSLLIETVQTTTIRTQKGNGEVTTESTSETLSWTLERLTCHVDGRYLGVAFSNNDVPVDVCEHPENYPPDILPFL